MDEDDDQDWGDYDWGDDRWADEEVDHEADAVDDPDNYLTCPECGIETFADAEACTACGYWFTDADHRAAWRAGSASGRIVTIGLWVLGIAAGASLAVWLL